MHKLGLTSHAHVVGHLGCHKKSITYPLKHGLAIFHNHIMITSHLLWLEPVFWVLVNIFFMKKNLIYLELYYSQRATCKTLTDQK